MKGLNTDLCSWKAMMVVKQQPRRTSIQPSPDAHDPLCSPRCRSAESLFLLHHTTTMPSTSVLVFVSLGKTIAQITAELSPIPGLPILVEVLCGIIELCENIGHNK